MLDLLRDHPWLIVVGLGVSVPLVAIIFGTGTKYLTEVRRAELDANLKQEMIQRGMSAAEIKMVIETTTPRRVRRGMPDGAIREAVT
jgi:hypothetical protein